MATTLEDPRVRRDALATVGWTAVVAVGVVAGGALTARNPLLHTNAAPFHGRWEVVVRAPLMLALAASIAIVVLGPRLAEVIRWRWLLFAAPASAFVWSGLLASSVGGHGFVAPVTTRYDYLAGVAKISAPGEFLRTFTSALPSFPTHVRGHPPGLVMVLWFMDRVGLGAPIFAAILVVAVGASALAAVLVVVRHVCDEHAARRVAPFLVVSPAAVWIATSGDAFFTGVGAWAVAATVLATGSDRWGGAVVAGLLWAVALLSSYGLVLLAPVPVAIALRRRRLDVLAVTAIAATAALLVVALGTGFWWPSGLAATRRAYAAGFASDRTAAIFIWLNIAAVAVAVGPVIAPSLRRARGPAGLVAGAAVVGVLLADLSLLSKAEVERIWLPWVPWLLVATAAVPVLQRRRWLAAQAATALTVQVVLRSPW